MNQADTNANPTIVLIGSESGLIDSIASTLAPVRSVAAVVIHEAVEHAVRRPELEHASVIVVDLDSRRESLLALQALTTRFGLSIPVIVLTTSSAESDVSRCYDRHANCYVQKPVDLDRFVDVARSLVAFWAGPCKLATTQSRSRGGVT